MLDDLRRLDNLDKHRQLHIVAAVPVDATLSVEFLRSGERSNVDLRSSHVFPVTLDKRDRVVAKVVYLSPVSEPDPGFSLRPVLVYGERGSGMPRRLRRMPIVSFLTRISWLIEFEIVPRFAPLFPDGAQCTPPFGSSLGEPFVGLPQS